MSETMILNISKQEVLSKDLTNIRSIIENTLDKKTLIDSFQSSFILFDGYDFDVREIYEIPEIREWTLHLLKEYPQMLYYIDVQLGGLQNLILCVSNVEKRLQQGRDILLKVSIPSSIQNYLLETIRNSDKPKIFQEQVCNELLQYESV